MAPTMLLLKHHKIKLLFKMEGARQWHADLSTMQNVALSMSGYED